MVIPRKTDDDAGFTLIEVVVAMVIFTIFCAASLGLLVRSTEVTRGNLQRSAASNLATEQIQLARSANTIDIVNLTRTQKVANTTFTIAQTTKYLSSDSTSTVCDGSSAALAYKLVTVTVTWPNMGSISPIRADTLKAMGVGSDGLGTTGALAVGINDADGLSLAGTTVNLSNGATTTTGDDGCALFVGLAAGTYTATLNTPGYVGLTNTQSTTKSGLGVTAGTLTRTNISYDSVRAIGVTVNSPVTGGIVPATLPLRLSTSLLTETTFPVCPATGSPTSACATAPTTTTDGLAKELFPAVYAVKLGSCAEAVPSQTSVDLRPDAANGAIAAVPLGAVTVKVALSATPTIGIIGRTVTFTHAVQSGTGCTAGETYSMPTVGAGSSMLLPYGTWVVSVPIFNVAGLPTSSLVMGTAVLSPTNRVSTQNLLVAL